MNPFLTTAITDARSTGIRPGHAALFAALLTGAAVGAPALLEPTVEVEEPVYSFTPANNGAGPMWCHGSTCLVRHEDRVVVSGLETLPDAKPLNNCRWLLFTRKDADSEWQASAQDETGRTREPCPLVRFHDGRIFLSANPTLVADPDRYDGPAQPTILEFLATSTLQPVRTLLPTWAGEPKFTEHSYRSFAADGDRGELILLQNVGYTHAEWTLLDSTGNWSAQGRLRWPWGADYDKPQPIRVCYPNVALRDRAVYFCGVSDIIEPNPTWRAFKRELTAREWDYDFRRLFYTWTPDVARSDFAEWVEVASREATAGWITPGDLHVSPDGTAHLLWTERALDERLRPRFFPDALQSYSLNYARIRNGRILSRRALLTATEGGSSAQPGRGRFHVTPDGRLCVIVYVSGTDPDGLPLSENRLLQLDPAGTVLQSRRLPLERPFTDFFTATPRAGSAPSYRIDLFGIRAGEANTMAYARVALTEELRSEK